MAVVSQTIFSDAFPLMKSFVFWLRFHWTLFLKGQIDNNPSIDFDNGLAPNRRHAYEPMLMPMNQYCMPMNQYCMPMNQYCMPMNQYCMPMNQYCMPMNQCSPESSTHICGIRGRWVNKHAVLAPFGLALSLALQAWCCGWNKGCLFTILVISCFGQVASLWTLVNSAITTVTESTYISEVYSK